MSWAYPLPERVAIFSSPGLLQDPKDIHRNDTIKSLPLFLILFVTCLTPGVTLGAPGKCMEGDCGNGRGTIIYPGGAKYVGECREGERHGKELEKNSYGN
jgi:hypothetical protein